jgi:hypothetical protein
VYRLDLADLRRNLPPEEDVPDLLARLLDYQNRTPNFNRVDGLLSWFGHDWFGHDWFGHDQRAASQFAIFGHSTDGSMYGYWLYSGRSLQDAPIVLLYSDRDGRLLANTLRDFLALLTTGEPLDDNSDEVSELSQTLLDYRSWLSAEMGIGIPADSEAILAAASADHPDLNDWLRQWSVAKQPAAE